MASTPGPVAVQAAEIASDVDLRIVISRARLRIGLPELDPERLVAVVALHPIAIVGARRRTWRHDAVGIDGEAAEDHDVTAEVNLAHRWQHWQVVEQAAGIEVRRRAAKSPEIAGHGLACPVHIIPKYRLSRCRPGVVRSASSSRTSPLNGLAIVDDEGDIAGKGGRVDRGVASG